MAPDMEYFHGVRATQQQVPHETVREAKSGIPFVVGTAPVHMTGGMTGGKANWPVLCASFEDAKEQLGYSDDWEKYTLCEFMKSHFGNYKARPAVFVNVLDPTQHKETVTEEAVAVVDGVVTLSVEAIAETMTVKAGEAELTPEEDYVVYRDSGTGELCMELLAGGAGQEAESVICTYDRVVPEKITKENIIGGKDTRTRQVCGFEVLEYVYHMVGLAPDLLLAPGWSKDPEVAMVMAAKAENINCVFRGLAIADVDSGVCTAAEDLAEYKAEHMLTDSNLVLCWPMVRYGGRLYHLSTAFAGTAAVTDAENGNVPCASPSNMPVMADAACLADGTEIMMNVNEATYINNLGIVTVLLRFIEGHTLYGGQTAGWPEAIDLQNGDIAGNRMFDFICNNLIVKTWSKVDKRMTRRIITETLDTINNWLNGLAADEKILGGRVEFKAEDNTAEQMANGIIFYRVYLGVAPTSRDIEYIVQVDMSYLESLIAELAS